MTAEERARARLAHAGSARRRRRRPRARGGGGTRAAPARPGHAPLRRRADAGVRLPRRASVSCRSHDDQARRMLTSPGDTDAEMMAERSASGRSAATIILGTGIVALGRGAPARPAEGQRTASSAPPSSLHPILAPLPAASRKRGSELAVAPAPERGGCSPALDGVHAARQFEGRLPPRSHGRPLFVRALAVGRSPRTSAPLGRAHRIEAQSRCPAARRPPRRVVPRCAHAARSLRKLRSTCACRLRPRAALHR